MCPSVSNPLGTIIFVPSDSVNVMSLVVIQYLPDGIKLVIVYKPPPKNRGFLKASVETPVISSYDNTEPEL